MKDNKLSSLFFEHLLSVLPKDGKYLYNDNEFLLSTGDKIYTYDFCDLTTKRIVEFHGNFFHANPMLYDIREILSFKQVHHRVGDIWKKDYRKIETAYLNGYGVYIVWESDYKLHGSKVISCVKKFLLD